MSEILEQNRDSGFTDDLLCPNEHLLNICSNCLVSSSMKLLQPLYLMSEMAIKYRQKCEVQVQSPSCTVTNVCLTLASCLRFIDIGDKHS